MLNVEDIKTIPDEQIKQIISEVFGDILDNLSLPILYPKKFFINPELLHISLFVICIFSISYIFMSIIFDEYGEKNFLRWINESRIDDRIKTLIVEYLDEKEYPNFAGLYNWNTNTLSVQESYDDKSKYKVIIHEFN